MLSTKTFPDCKPTCGDGYYCGVCTDRLRRRSYAKMTPAEKAYDNHVDPAGAYHTDYSQEPSEPDCCSCHINPPCSYCVGLDDEEVEPHE